MSILDCLIYLNILLEEWYMFLYLSSNNQQCICCRFHLMHILSSKVDSCNRENFEECIQQNN